MKTLLNNKKFLIGIVATLILIGLIVGGTFLLGKDKGEKTQDKETTNNYIAYVKINPVIKIEYSQTCKNENCDNPIVTKYELLDDDAKDIYNNIDLIGTNNNLYDVLVLISNTAKENDIEFETVEIYSNWENINNYIDNSNNDEYSWSYIINIRDKENLEEISNALIENKILYTVSFDTDRGSEINPQTIEKGNNAIQPGTPTKKGYTFVEWQLDGKLFDFNTEITSDITLKAKWEKLENSNSNSNKTENKQDNTSKNENKTKEISISNIAINNSSDKYIYSLTKNETIKITITGKENLINNINENNVNLYVDASGLNVGTHSVDIKISGINSNLTYTLNPKKININVADNTKAYLDFGDLYSLERIHEIENKYNIKINLVADATCGYLEGGDGQLIESGKTYTAHINSLDPYVQGVCEGSGEGTTIMPDPNDWECLEDGSYCAVNLFSNQNLLSCAKQLRDLSNVYLNYVNTHNDYPLLTDINLSSYNLLYVIPESSSPCDYGDCSYLTIECKAVQNTDIDNNLFIVEAFRNK